MTIRYITCGQLTADPDRIAPVSEVRCRDCGANARNRDAKEVWAVHNRAAYCLECMHEATRDGGRLPDAEG